jgi:large repetitive protein
MGNGGDSPETAIEALYQIATGMGFDGNGNGNTTDSGPAGRITTQTIPGTSGDVPAFSSFMADPTPPPAGPVVLPSGDLGGVGFRPEAARIVIVATDAGFAYQPDLVDPYTGHDGVTVPASTQRSIAGGDACATRMFAML